MHRSYISLLGENESVVKCTGATYHTVEKMRALLGAQKLHITPWRERKRCKVHSSTQDISYISHRGENESAILGAQELHITPWRE